jgi:hypothetical protein
MRKGKGLGGRCENEVSRQVRKDEVRKREEEQEERERNKKFLSRYQQLGNRSQTLHNPNTEMLA